MLLATKGFWEDFKGFERQIKEENVLVQAQPGTKQNLNLRPHQDWRGPTTIDEAPLLPAMPR